MHVSLRSRWRCAAFCILVLASVGVYALFATRSYVAFHKSTSTTSAALLAAIRLEPTNSDYHHRTGLISLFVDQNFDAATQHYKTAVALNPHVAKYWIDLAEAYNTSGNTQAEADALQHAIEAEPTRPAIAWEAANLYLVQGNTPEALRLLKVVLENEPTAYTFRVLDTSWRATHDAKLILHDVLPPEPAMYATFLQLLIEQDKTDEAAEVWRGLASLGKPFDPKLALPYFDYEIRNQRPESAKKIWEYLLKMDGGPDNEGPGDLVFNGGFDHDLLNGGFDWRFSGVPHVQAELDTTEIHGGNRSLALASDGEPWSDAGIYQFMPAEPNTAYKFSAFERSYELLTPSGPRFRITDAYSGATLFESSDLLGSTVWSQVSGQFTTGPQTRVLKLTIVRNPSFQRITGRFWVDDVSIRKQ